MRKIKLFVTFLCVILIVVLCSTPAFAKENEWYVDKANAVNNPIVDDVEYYEGVSLLSNPISDLTFLQIPFEK